MYIEFEKGQKYANNLNDISDSHEAFRDAGYVIETNDLIVDIDEIPKELIRNIINFFNIKTQIVWTNRGAHLYFKKPDGFRGANQVSPLGFHFEYKHMANTKAITIKRDGILREIENEGVREDIPYIFKSRKKFENLLGLSEGEGRNNKLFELRSKLSDCKDWRKILTFVNEYVFAEPLDEKELSTVTREMSTTADKDAEYDIAEWVRQDTGFLNYGERYYFKYGDEYRHEEKYLKKLVSSYTGRQKSFYVEEVIRQLKIRAKIIPQETVFKIKFNNGYLENGKFVDMEIDEFTPYSIDVDYIPDAKPVKVVDDYVNHLTKNNESYKKLLFEMLGHTLIVDPEFKRLLAKFFIFIGEGGNGKGTLLQIIKYILGTENTTAMSIKELSDERYLASFKGKLANLGDDIQDQAIDDKDMKVLKNISTCDYIATRELYKQSESMYFTGSLIFASNHVIKSFEKGKSYKRRVLWLPMYTKVKKKDPKFITKLTTKESLEYWIKLIVDGYFRLYENGDFTRSEIVEEFNKRYHEENNPALSYLFDKTPKDFIDKPVKQECEKYEAWCDDNDLTYSKKMLYETLKEKFRIDSNKRIYILGIQTRVFGSIDDEDKTK